MDLLCRIFGHSFDESTILKIDITSSLVQGNNRPYKILLKYECRRCPANINHTLTLRNEDDAMILTTKQFELINTK